MDTGPGLGVVDVFNKNFYNFFRLITFTLELSSSKFNSFFYSELLRLLGLNIKALPIMAWQHSWYSTRAFNVECKRTKYIF